jgi:hypothetical protein
VVIPGTNEPTTEPQIKVKSRGRLKIFSHLPVTGFLVTGFFVQSSQLPSPPGSPAWVLSEILVRPCID